MLVESVSWSHDFSIMTNEQDAAWVLRVIREPNFKISCFGKLFSGVS